MTFTDALEKMLAGHRIRRGLPDHLWLFIPKFDDEMARFEIMQAWSEGSIHLLLTVTLSREDFTATDWEVGPVCVEPPIDFSQPVLPTGESFELSGKPFDLLEPRMTIPGTYTEKDGVFEIAMDDGKPLALDMNAIKE